MYGNYGRNANSRYNNTASGAQPKRLLPEQLHDVFRIEINRLNNNREIIEPNGLLFDSDIEQNKSSLADDLSQKNTNKYTLQSVYIGEIWRFRVKISNKLNEHLINFGLLCHIELNMKGNGSPTQLYPRPSEVCPPQMRRGDNVAIDLEYPVTSNEPSAYSLIFTITCSTEDDVHQLYKDIFEFHAVPCISLSYQKQTLDENLFVEALINNVSNQPKLPLYVEVNFKCMGLFKSYNLTHHNKEFAVDDNNTDDVTVYLDPGKEKNVLFQISMKNPTSLVNLNALSVGQIEIKWKSFDESKATNTFREGIFLSDIIQRRSLFCRKLPNVESTSSSPSLAHSVSNKSKSQSDNIEILILKCPSSSVVHEAFTVTFHIFNLDRFAQRVWLSIDRNRSGYLLPCNISRRNLGVLETSSSMKTDMTLIGFAAGIHVLTGIVIQTQRASGGDGDEMKTMHYESSQYIYIDIDEKFHEQKLKEKKERELVLRKEMENYKNIDLDQEEVEMESDHKEREGVDDEGDAVDHQPLDEPGTDPMDDEKEGNDIDGDDDDDAVFEQEEEERNAVGIGMETKMEMEQEYEVEDGGDAVAMDQQPKPPEMEMELESQAQVVNEMEFDGKNAVEEMDAEIGNVDDGYNDQDIGGGDDDGDDVMQRENAVDGAMIDIQTQMKHRGSFTLESNDQTSLKVDVESGMGNEQEMNLKEMNNDEEAAFEINPSPENKPTLPTETIPIGHKKSEEEIQAEIEEEEKQEMASLQPLGSPGLDSSNDAEITSDGMDKESAVPTDTLSEDVPADDLDVSALEITDDVPTANQSVTETQIDDALDGL